MTNKNQNTKYPLRLIIDWFRDDTTGKMKERLECGHIINRKQDIDGDTIALRRRCFKCPRRDS
jgi:hypothetical protein